VNISSMLQKKLDNRLAVVASSKMQRCRVTAINITTVDCVRMSRYKFLYEHNNDITA